MHKILVVAWREYRAAVRSKAFLITIILMPVLMLGSVAVQALLRKLEDRQPKTYAVIDRSPGKFVLTHLLQEKDKHNLLVADPRLADLLGPAFDLQEIPPSPADPEEIARQRYDVSRQIEQGKYEALVEIGPEVLEVFEGIPDPDAVDDAVSVRFQTKNPLQGNRFLRWVRKEIDQAVVQKRFEERGVSRAEVRRLQRPVVIRTRALTRLDPNTGTPVDAPDESRFVNLFLPGVLIALMFMIIMVGATPAMQGIVEEKGQRIVEVLLGSVTPFQLMAGKLLGVLGTSLTMALVYLAGGLFIAWRFGLADILSLPMVLWFLAMLVLALMLFGSLFLAVGAAASDIKDTQTLLMPLMLIACLPFFAMGTIMQDPSGTVATVLSFFPFSTPMLLVARESVPPGVPLWEKAAAVAGVLATTLLCVWAAGRIFRIGILAQGKRAGLADLVRWILRG